MNFKLKNFKKIKPYYLVVMLVSGLLLLICSNLYSYKPETNEKTSDELHKTVSNTTNIETRLAEIVEKIDGVETADVFITFENNGIKKHAANIKDDTVTGKDSVTVKKEKTAVMKKESASETPFISEETLPQVRGVLIVANGVNDLKLQDEITSAVSAVLGVPLHKVRVLPAK